MAELELLSAVGDVPRDEWNALVADGSPFLEWEWLASPGGGGLRGRGHRLAAAPPGAARGGARGRRLPALRQGQQRGRVRLRLRLGGRGLSRGHRLLPEAAGGRALHAGHGRTLPHRPGSGSSLRRRRTRIRAASDLRPEPALRSPRELLPGGRTRGAGDARLAAPTGLPIPLAEPGLRELRRLPGRAPQQASQPDPPRAPRAREPGRRDRTPARRRDRRRPLRADVSDLPRDDPQQPVGAGST